MLLLDPRYSPLYFNFLVLSSSSLLSSSQLQKTDKTQSHHKTNQPNNAKFESHRRLGGKHVLRYKFSSNYDSRTIVGGQI